MALTKSERSLFNAVLKGNLKQVKIAVKKVPDLDFEGDYGRTSLEQAIFDGSQPMVEALLEAGADINRVNDLDQTPLDFARSQGETKIAAFLKGEGARKASEASASTSRFGGSRFDDDYDDYFSRGFDDDDDWGAPKKTAARKSKSPARQPARKSFGKMTATGADDDSGGNAKPEKADQPVKPKFTEESLKDIFNAKNWVGKAEEMQKLWDDVPAKLQKKYDFDTALAEAKRETLRKNAPQAPRLNAPPKQDAQNAPPAAPPPAGQ